MRTSINFRRYNQYGLTILELNSPDLDIELKLLARLDPRERRAIVRSFLGQIKPWIRLFTRSTIDHSSSGYIRRRRSHERGVSTFESRPISTLKGQVGFEIRMQRLKFGLSQAELAAILNVRRSHLSDIERGLHLPRPRIRAALEKALSIRWPQLDEHPSEL